jgi:Acetyltransferases, including N-acetylases of ribosomal proteins
MSDGPVTISGERVTLRALRPDEIEEQWQEMLHADPIEIVAVPDEAAFKARLARSGHLANRVIDLAIDVDGSAVGRIQTFLPPDRLDQPDVYNVGIALKAEQRGRGYASDALRAFTRWLLDEGARRVEGRTDPDNVAMQKVFDRLGWTLAGELEDGGRTWLLYVIDR